MCCLYIYIIQRPFCSIVSSHWRSVSERSASHRFSSIVSSVIGHVIQRPFSSIVYLVIIRSPSPTVSSPAMAFLNGRVIQRRFSSIVSSHWRFVSERSASRRFPSIVSSASPTVSSSGLNGRVIQRPFSSIVSSVIPSPTISSPAMAFLDRVIQRRFSSIVSSHWRSVSERSASLASSSVINRNPSATISCSELDVEAVALDTNCVGYLALANLSWKYSNRERQKSVMNLQNKGLSDSQLDHLLSCCRRLYELLNKRIMVVGSAVCNEYYSAPAVSFRSTTCTLLLYV